MKTPSTLTLNYRATLMTAAEFTPLLHFALSKCQHVDNLRTINVYDAIVADWAASGQALSTSIDIWVPEPGLEYPFMSNYLPKLMPPFRVLSREEDVLLVVAHELRHVEQFKLEPHKVRASPSSASAFNETELDAETFGQAVCLQWRLMNREKEAA